MIKRKMAAVESKPYAVNPDIEVKAELLFGDDVIVPGDKIRFKNERGIFTFIRVAFNSKINKEWIDCYGPADEFKSFYVEQLKSVIRPKKPRARKLAK